LQMISRSRAKQNEQLLTRSSLKQPPSGGIALRLRRYAHPISFGCAVIG
jgi:hypothetical protein